MSFSGPTSHADSWSPLGDGTAPSQEMHQPTYQLCDNGSGERAITLWSDCGFILVLCWDLF